MRVKFCGITRTEDAREAARLGAWAIGLIHHDPSPRRVDPAVAAEIGAELRRQLQVVGVFVNAPLDEVVKAAEDESLTMLQLHGDEGPAFCQEAARRTGCRIIKAFRVRSSADVHGAEAFRTDLHLFDAHRPGTPGGTGESFDWELLAGHRSTVPFMLSGGLDSGNVAEAVGIAHPYAVDVASGVEAEPGVKDHDLMAVFFASAQPAVADAVADGGTPVSAVASVEERFGPYGGRFVPEVLMAALDELSAAWVAARDDGDFRDRLAVLLRDFVGRPTPLYAAERLSERVGRRVYLKREDLAHTGAHKINNAVGQALLAQRMGKRRVIAETGAGQHGVATATACALLGLDCLVYMGTEDMRRQAPNVERMRLLGAEVAPVEAGARTLKEAVSAAIRDWVTNVADTHYIIGSAVGPAPYPALVRDLQRVIGDEARGQALAAEGALPERVIACVGGGSNAIGAFYAFLDDPVELIGIEAGGEGLDGTRHGASLVAGRTGVLHGAMSSILADSEGQILEAHSVSAGLDYPGVGPEHAHLRDTGRARYEAVTDVDALRAFRELARLEGIVPALEPAHAIAWLLADEGPSADPGAPGRGAEEATGFDVLCLSGRGDKDMAEVTALLDQLDG